MLPDVAAVTFAMKALCLAANSGLFSRRLLRPPPVTASVVVESSPATNAAGVDAPLPWTGVLDLDEALLFVLVAGVGVGVAAPRNKYRIFKK